MTPAGSKPGDSLAILKTHYEDRLLAARQARAAGARVVGRIGATVPTEFLLAAGFAPVLVSADRSRPTPTATVYLDDIIAPETRSLFEAGVGGDFEFMDMLVLSRPYDKLFYYLKELYRLGRAPCLPPLQMFDLMQSQRSAVSAYNRGRTAAFIEVLERASAAEIKDDALSQAIMLMNSVRQTQRRLLEQRRRGRVSGVDALHALGAGYFMHPAQYVDVLHHYVSEVEAAADISVDGLRVVVATSEPLDHVGLHQALEDSGALVVAEDDWWGARAPGADCEMTGSPREAVLQKYWMDMPTAAVFPPEAREAWLMAEAARDDVDAVIFYIPPSDQEYGWDYPRLAAQLAAMPKPTLLVRHEATEEGGRMAIAQQFAQFSTELGARRSVHTGGGSQ